MCYYKSGIQTYPNAMIYLGAFELIENPHGFELRTPVNTYKITHPSDKELLKKRKKYSKRQNYVEGCGAWVAALRNMGPPPVPRPIAAPPMSPPEFPVQV